ncbi:MAG: sigma-70 family RNA polymerase sigma factor [bacterium]
MKMGNMDRQDWRDFRHVDKQAFDRIYLRYKDRQYGYPRVACETVRQSRGAGLDRGLDIWLFVRVRNCLYNHLKEHRVRQNHEYTQALTDGADYNQGEARNMLRQMLARLDVRERELILMREFLGLTIPEIAAVAGDPDGAVRVRLHRVRKSE